MGPRGRWSMALVGIAGTAWALATAECGLWLLMGMPGSEIRLGGAGIAGGVTFLAMSQFIFTALVADRVFPDFGRKVGWWVEAGAAAVLLLGLGTAATLILGGSTE